MPEAVDCELLFFDTFSHENTEELNLDLVQFPRPVLIHEVRVVPLGTRVQADVPGGTRLGATNPSSFKLDLFVNNLTKPNAATFEKLGVLDYKGNENIQLPLELTIPTDGLIIKGWYSAITLAVYGCPTTVTKDRASPPPPPPPRSKAQVVIPPTVVENVQPNLTPQPAPQPANKTPNDWETTAATPTQVPEVNFQASGPPPASVPPQNMPAAQPAPAQVEVYHDIDERYQGAQGNTQSTGSSEKRSTQVKEAPQVEVGEHGEAKFPEGNFESDELFEAYLKEKDRKREEREREKAERDRERAERYRGRESRSHSPDRGVSRGHTRSLSRSRSRSTERDYSRSRDREYRETGSGRDYRDREHRDKDSDKEYRDRYRDRSRERADSRDRRDSRERDKEVKERRDSRERENRRLSSPERQSRRENIRDRRDSGERGRDRTPDRAKSPRSRTPRRSRSRTPPSRRSRSRSRERDRPYERDRGRDYKERGDRERDKDYDKPRDKMDKEREPYREKDFDREHRSDRVRDDRRDSDGPKESRIDVRIERDRDVKDRPERDGWGRSDGGRRDMENEKMWDKNRDGRDGRDIRELGRDGRDNRDLRDARDLQQVNRPEWNHPREQLEHRQDHRVWNQPPPEGIQPIWNNRDAPKPIETIRDGETSWGQPNREQQEWGNEPPGRITEMDGTWAPPPQAAQVVPQQPFAMMPNEPVPPVMDMCEDMPPQYEGIPDITPGSMEDMYTPLSDGEIEEEPAYSDISSDENFLDSLNEEDLQQKLAEWSRSIDGIEDPWHYAISSFNPYQCDLTPLETYNDPSLTEYEIEKQKMLGKDITVAPDDAQKILEIVDKFEQAPHNEEWIEAVESVAARLNTGLSYLVNKSGRQDVLDTLVEYTLEGLDVNKAMKQPITAYKVRHLKLGVRLAGALCACDTVVALKLLSKDIQHILIDMFENEYISSSVKLQVIKSLDNTVRLKDGMEWFLGKHPLQALKGTAESTLPDSTSETGVKIKKEPGLPEEDESLSQRKTPYSRYLNLITKKQMSRVMLALTALLRKVHLYDLLNRLSTIVEMIQDRYEHWLAENATYPDAKSSSLASSHGHDEETAMDTDVESDLPVIPDNMTADDIESLICCLHELTKLILNADHMLGQPPKTMAHQQVFEITKAPFDPVPAMFHMFTSTQVLEAVFVLLSSPATFNHNGVFGAVKDLLTCLISSQTGLLYLCTRHVTVNGIIRALTQTTGYTEEEEEGAPRGPHPAHVLGLQMIYYLQTLQNIDRLREYHSKDQTQKELDDAEPLGLLHSLYMMTFSLQGREAVVHVFTMSDNLQALLPFIELTDDDAKDVKIKRSVCHSYTVLLLLEVVRHSQNLEYLQKYGQKLLVFSEQEPASNKTFDKITELQDWLAPLKKVPVFAYEANIIAELVKLIKQYTEEMADFPKGLVTVLRILRFLCLEPEVAIDNVREKEGPKEMKYKYALIEVFSADAMPLFQTLLQKISDMLTRPFQQTLPRVGMQNMVIYYTVKPVLKLVKHILSNVIDTRGEVFRDMTMLPCIFGIHTVLCSVSHSGTLSTESQDIQNEIVDILMSYTQPPLQAEQTEETLAKSQWTTTIKELLKYVLTAPYTFLSGLILSSELLPLPLPIQTKEPLTNEEVTIAVNQRKLWSAHLQPLPTEIHAILLHLSGSACQPLQQLLRRVCWQLADLAAPSALMVVRCLLDTVTDSMDVSIEKDMTDAIKALPPEERPLAEVFSSGETAKILNLLAFLMNQPPVKAAFIHITSGKSRLTSDEKYKTVLLRLARLLNVISEKAPHIQAQESIVSIFQSLCDLEVTMIPPENNMLFVGQLANSLPARDQMAVVCEALLLHVDQRDHSFSSILPALRTLALLMLHDFGFYHVKMALDNVPRAFYNLFQQINCTFSKDSSDCIATLSSAIELLQFLVALPEAPEGEEQTVPFERTYLISYRDLRDVLKWNRDPTAPPHPLTDLDNLLHEYAKEEETLKAVYESVNLVVSILKSDEDQSKPEMEEPVLPEPESLQAQFNMRSIYLITDDEDDRLSATYWLATPMGEDADDQEEMVATDFEEICHKYCQDFDLAVEVEKGAVPSDPPVIKRRRSRIGRRLETINTSKMRGKSGRFVAPMRGRGFGRAMPINKNDMFRSRPQNTSRPPSMHVDDFIKMELQGGQAQIGPTGMNPHLNKFREQLSEHGGNISRGSRGGGFQSRGGGGRGRGSTTRGRFLSPPDPYARSRDLSRDGGWGGGGFGSSEHSPGPQATSRGGYRGRGSATGMTIRGSPPKPPSPWGGSRPPHRQDNFHRGFHTRGPGDWGQRSDGHGGGRGFGGRGGRGAWRGRDDRRFMPPPGTPPFYGRRENRHQRSFTK